MLIDSMRIHKIKIIHMVAIFSLGTVLDTRSQSVSSTNEHQQQITLNEVLLLATNNSLDAFKAKRKYGASYWAYKSYNASLLPKINLRLQPFTFNQTLTERYDPVQNIDVYRQQQNINSFGSISLEQNIGATGTRVFINSSLSRLKNTGEVDIENYFATPFRIGLVQPLMAFNPFKWQKKTAPIEYEKAKQDFMYELQGINLKVVDLFFNWALASKNVEIANENLASAEKLYEIGNKRYELASIERNDLLNLELDLFNANTNLAQNRRKLQKAETELNLFLRNPLPRHTIPELPELISSLQINLDQAIGLAMKNNPFILDLELKKVQSLRDLDKSIKDNRLDLSLDASYGLNKQAETFSASYNNFLNQQLVAIRLTLPLLDWGERKGNINTARTNKEVVDIEIQQNEDTFMQNLILIVSDFNLQKNLVDSALRASKIAEDSYRLTERRFLSGRVDLLNLSSARIAWQSATERYIQSLQNYWSLYYKVQQLTLYNFMNDTRLTQDFDKILDP